MPVATLMSLALYGLNETGVFEDVGHAVSDLGSGIKDIFVPEPPEAPEVPAPPIQSSSLAAMQSEERSLINRSGLATTKKVNNSLLRQKPQQKLGGTSV